MVCVHTTIFLVKMPASNNYLSIDFAVEQSACGRPAAAAPNQKRTIVIDGSIHRCVLFVAARKGSQEKQKSTLKACDAVVTLRQLAASTLRPNAEVETVVAAAKLGGETTTFIADGLGYGATQRGSPRIVACGSYRSCSWTTSRNSWLRAQQS